MSDSQLFRKKTYRTNGSQAAIIFICPFGTKLWLVRPVIKRLQKAGYTVAAYDTTNDAFYAANPNVLVQLVDTIAKDVADSIKDLHQAGIEDIGVFGSSLGAFLAYNCVSRFPRQLRWGVFNTGGDVAEAMWRIKKARRKHQKQGVTQEQLSAAWRGIQYPGFFNLEGNSYIFLSSPSDKIAPIGDIDKCMDPVRQAGAQVQLLSVRAIGHSSTVVRGFKRSVELLAEVRSQVE